MRQTTARRRAKTTLPVVLVLNVITGLLTGGATYYLITKKQDQPPTSEKDRRLPEKGKNDIAALGRLEPAAGVYDIAAAPGDLVREVRVQENQNVEPVADPLRETGKELVVLESDKAREQEIDQLQRQYDEAKKKYAAALVAARTTIKVANAKKAQVVVAAQNEVPALRVKEDQLESRRKAEQDFLDKLERLGKDPNSTVSPQQLTTQRLVVAGIMGELATTRAAIKTAEVVQPKNEAIADAQVEAAQADLDRAQADDPEKTLKPALDAKREAAVRNKVYSPIKGKVLKVFAKKGEAVGPRPLMQVADTENMVVVAEVYESDVLDVSPGMAAKAVSTALPPPYYVRENPKSSRGLTGEVVSVGTQVAKNRIFDLDPTAAVDRRVVEVRVKLDPESAQTAAKFLNLQVNVFFLRSGAPAPTAATPPPEPAPAAQPGQ
jgi:HlyD family secretion protein